MVAQFETSHLPHPRDPVEPPPLDSGQRAQEAKSLICALGLVSRNLPLPPDLFDAVSSIYGDAAAAPPGGGEVGGGGSEEGLVSPRWVSVCSFALFWAGDCY